MSWSRQHECCVGCGTMERPHVAQGHCMACYRRKRRAGDLDRVRNVKVVTWTPSERGPAVAPGARWSPASDACLDCGQSDQEHCAHGLCRRCYMRRYGRAYRRTAHGRSRLKAGLLRWLDRPENLAAYREVNRHTSRISRERKFGNKADIPLGYEALVFNVFGRRCAACGSERNLVLDHHIPIQLGRSLLHNAVPLCRRCNARKSRRQPADFYDDWKLAEILVLLHEARAAYEAGLGGR